MRLQKKTRRYYSRGWRSPTDSAKCQYLSVALSMVVRPSGPIVGKTSRLCLLSWIRRQGKVFLGSLWDQALKNGKETKSAILMKIIEVIEKK